MHEHYIDEMVRKLGPVLKDKAKAKTILTRYWQNKMALVWDTEDVHRAANEWDLALTEKEANQILQTLHSQHNAQYGIKWEDITTHIQDNGLGRKMTKQEVERFVKKDILTIQR